MPKISIIVPVYKAEPYLHRCVESILAQTYGDFELILVNDGSPDRSGEICEEYAKKDPRVSVMHKENGGQATARNMAIDWVFAHSDSQWLHFVDSDDYIHPRLLEVLLNAAVEQNVRVSVCKEIETNGEALPEESPVPPTLLTPGEYYRTCINQAAGPCAKLFRKELFQQIRFPRGKLYEDAFIMYRLYFQCERIALVDWIGYAYFSNPDSSIRKPWTMRKLHELEAVQEQIDYFAQQGDEEMRKFMIRRYMRCLLWQLAEIKKQEDEEIVQKGKKELHRLGRRLLRIYRRDRLFSGEKDLWICARFYPLETKVSILWQAVLRKLGTKQKEGAE